MNIKDIPFIPDYQGIHYVDYKLRMEDVIEEKHVKTWIEELQIIDEPEELKQRLLQQGYAYLRIRHEEDGTVVNMELSDDGTGVLCNILYLESENWPRMVGLIKKARDKNE